MYMDEWWWMVFYRNVSLSGKNGRERGEKDSTAETRGVLLYQVSPPFYRVRDKNTEIAGENKGEINLCAGI